MGYPSLLTFMVILWFVDPESWRNCLRDSPSKRRNSDVLGAKSQGLQLAHEDKLRETVWGRLAHLLPLLPAALHTGLCDISSPSWLLLIFI